MPAIGITGGISTGKTTFCEFLREIIPSATFFNADQAAHHLVDLDPDVRKEVEAEFGSAIYFPNGDLNRAKLRAIILESAEKRSALEKILHPRIRRQWSAEAQKHRQPFDFFFADIPLLYETGGETLCDKVVVVACSPQIQLARLQERGRIGRRAVATVGAEGEASATPSPNSQPLPQKSLLVGEELAPSEVGAVLDRMTAERLMKTQMSLKEKIRRADHVVWNNGGRAELMEQARLLVQLWQA
jgi:dephospho-CoA kinase